MDDLAAAVAGFLLHNFMRRRFSLAMRQPFSRLGAVMTFIAGATAVLIKRFSRSLRLAIPPLVLIAFTLFTACLARVEIVFEEEGKRKQARKLTVLLTTYERRILEVVLCFAVISSAYYPAFACAMSSARTIICYGYF